MTPEFTHGEWISPGRGFSTNRRMRLSAASSTTPALRGVRTPVEGKRGVRDGSRRPVKRHERAEIQIGQDVAVDDEEGILEERLDPLDAAGGAEQLRLLRVADLDAEAGPVAEVAAHRLRPVVQVDGDPADPVVPQPADGVLEHRLARDRDHRLGQRLGHGIAAGSPCRRRESSRSSRGARAPADVVRERGLSGPREKP